MASTGSGSVQRWSKLTVSMAACGALLGPLLDNYHSQFNVLAYSAPKILLNGSVVTDSWVPPLFGLAGAIIGVGSVWLQTLEGNSCVPSKVREPFVLALIGAYSLEYYLSGLLSALEVPSAEIFGLMAAYSTGLCWVVPREVRKAVVLLAVATSIGGPAVEWVLLSFTNLYHYVQSDYPLRFPVWILPVYLGGGPAVGVLGCMFAQKLGILEAREH